MLTLIGLTIVVLVAWYAVAATAGPAAPASTRLVLTWLGASGQWVVTTTLAGATGVLTVTVIGIANAALAVLVLMLARRALQPPFTLAAMARRDRETAIAACRAALSWELAVIAILLLFASAWILTALAVYPPRGIDDVTYHLPPIYQAIQDHRLTVLPIELRGHFGYPLNAEMLFLLVPLFAGSIQWIAAPQAAFWIAGMIAVYALGRRSSLAPRGAALAAALFGAMPVCLLQATTNYVDLISAGWLLSAIIALWHYEATGSRVALAFSGAGVGLLAGTKVSTLTLCAVIAVAAMWIIGRVVRRARERIDAAVLFAAPMLISGAYWYVRDWIVLNNPFYPYPIRVFGRTIFDGTLEIGRNSWSAIVVDPLEALRVGVWDPGLGTFHGGFGFLFWGFAVPAVGLQLVRLAQDRRARSVSRLLLLSLLPFGLATLFLVGHADLFVFARLILVAGAPVFVGYAALVGETRGRLPGAGTALRALAIVAVGSSLLLMAAARWPLLTLQPIAADSPAERALSPFRYLAAANWDHRPLSLAWAPLDEITSGGRGLTVYQSADWPVFWTASTYGRELQNRLWNFVQDPAHPPEAFLFHSRTGAPFHLGRTVTRDAIGADARYRLIAASRSDVTTLYVATAALATRERGERLARYYRVSEADMVANTATALADLDPDAVVVARFPFAAGFIVHESDRRLRPALRPTAVSDFARAVAALTDRVVYTTGFVIPGRTSRPVAWLQEAGSPAVPLLRHEPAGQERVAR